MSLTSNVYKTSGEVVTFTALGISVFLRFRLSLVVLLCCSRIPLFLFKLQGLSGAQAEPISQLETNLIIWVCRPCFEYEFSHTTMFTSTLDDVN